MADFRAVLDPLVPLARHIFAAPTQYYKTGVVFLAWLSGYQDRFVMVAGQQASRDRVHLAELFRLAARRPACSRTPGWPPNGCAGSSMTELLDG